jgi:23S rRNA (uridine2552-2'-O)-methyltransferase
MARNKLDKAWLARHLRDPYVKQANRQGYRSRAAFKLMELDDKDRLLRPGMTVVDLGAAPGGWSQVAAERIGPSGRVVAIDLVEMQPLARVTCQRGDVRDSEAQQQLKNSLGDRGVDLVLSDMSPNLSGVKATDEARAQALVEVAVGLAAMLLKPDGILVVKIFHGAGTEAVIRGMRAMFRGVAVRKPPASRARSSEIYAVCRGLLGR